MQLVRKQEIHQYKKTQVIICVSKNIEMYLKYNAKIGDIQTLYY